MAPRKSKTITARYDVFELETTITSHMTTDNIYEAFRASLIDSYHITIHKASGELAQLSYPALKTNQLYVVNTPDARYQGAGTESSATKRIAANLEFVCAQWELEDASAIFPEGVCAIHGVSIAPRESNAENLLQSTKQGFNTPLLTPELWPRTFTDMLHSLSIRTPGRHAEALELLVEVMRERLAEGRDMVLECVSIDVKRAIARLVEVEGESKGEEQTIGGKRKLDAEEVGEESEGVKKTRVETFELPFR